MQKRFVAVVIIMAMAVMFAAGTFAQTAEQVLTLKQGFNFVSFTATPGVTPSQLKQNYPLLVEDIYLYSAAAGSFLSLSEGTLTSLAAGKGYIVKASLDGSITISGSAVTAISDISLKTGFNLIGISQSISTNTFSGLMKSFGIIKGLYKWSPAASSFIQVVMDINGMPQALDGADPQLKAGESYFVNVYDNTTLSFAGGSLSLIGGTVPVTPVTPAATDVPATVLTDLPVAEQAPGYGDIAGEITAPEETTASAPGAPNRLIKIVSLSNIKVWVKNHPEVNTLTNDLGQFTLKNVPAAAKGSGQTIEYEKIEGEDKFKGVVKDVPVIEKKKIDLKPYIGPAVIKKTGVIQGRVALADGLSPLGSDVYIAGISNMLAKVDEDGSFSMMYVPEGTFTLVFSSFGYEMFKMNVSVFTNEFKQLDRITLKKITQASTYSMVDGYIFDDTNTPLSNVLITLLSQDGTVDIGTVTTTTGHYEFKNLNAASYKLIFTKEGHEGGEDSLTLSAGSENHLNKNLKKVKTGSGYGLIAGYVKDSLSGAPIRSAVILTVPPTEQFFSDNNGAFSFLINPGSYTLIVKKAGYKEDQVTLTVKEDMASELSAALENLEGAAAVSSIALNLNQITIKKGLSFQFVPTLKDFSGNILYGKTVIWACSNASVGEMSAFGQFTANDAGTCKITASVGAVSASADITVVSNTNGLKSLKLYPETLSMNVDEKKKFNLVATFDDGQVKVIWPSLALWQPGEGLAAIETEPGAFLGVKAGSYQLKATFSNATAVSAVTVTENTTSDYLPPQVSHRIPVIESGKDVGITAYVADNVSVAKVSIFYRKVNDTSYIPALMTPAVDGSYSFVIPASYVSAGIEYYIKAEDTKTPVANFTIFPSNGDATPIKLFLTEISILGLSRISDNMVFNTPYDLSAISALVKYTNGATKMVVPSWSIKSGSGSISGSIFTPGEVVTGEVIITAGYTEGAITKTAELKLTITSAPKTMTPVLSPATTTFGASQTVMITCETFGASIYYTLDGSVPAVSSKLYSGPFIINSTTSIKAIAIKQGIDNSNVASATYTRTAPQVGWKTNFTEAKNLAVTSGKKLFVDFYGSWSYWCVEMDSKTYSDAQIANLMNNSYICVRLDDSIAEHRTLFNQYSITGSPVFMVFDASNMSVIDKLSGYIDSSALLTKLQGYLSAQPVLQTNLMGFENAKSLTYIISESSANNYYRPLYSTVKASVEQISSVGGFIDSTTAKNQKYWKVTDNTNKSFYFKTSGETGNVCEAIGLGISSPAIAFMAKSPLKMIDFGEPVGTTWAVNGPVSFFLSQSAGIPTGLEVNYTLKLDSKNEIVNLANGKSYECLKLTLTDAKRLSDSGGWLKGGSVTLYFAPNKGLIKCVSSLTEFGDTTNKVIYLDETGNGITKVAAPAFSPAAGNYSSAQQIALSCSTPGATIKYTTTNDMMPPWNGTTYSGPITVSQSTTISAIAMKDGMADSEVVNAAYVISATNFYPLDQADMIIFTATDNQFEQVASNGNSFTKLLAEAKAAGFKPAFVNMQTTTITASMLSGKKALIVLGEYPKTGGLTPAELLAVKNFVNAGGNLFQAGLAAGFSSLLSPEFGITMDAPQNQYTATYFSVHDITAGIASLTGAHHNSCTVALPAGIIGRLNNGGAGLLAASQYGTGKIVYWVSPDTFLDATIPTNAYQANIEQANNKQFLRNVLNWLKTSASPIQAAAPQFTPAAGTYTSVQNVSIASATPGATIKYTLDGSTPGASNGLTYSGTIEVSSTKTIKAVAMKAGMTDSSVTSALYTINISNLYALDLADMILFTATDNQFESVASNGNSFTKLLAEAKAAGFKPAFINMQTTAITAAMLSGKKALIVLAEYPKTGGLTSAELLAVKDFVSAGGNLFQAGLAANQSSLLSPEFGITKGVEQYQISASYFNAHELTAGVTNLTGAHHNACTAALPASLIGWVNNGGAGLLAVSQYGTGKIVYWASPDTFLDATITANAYQANIEQVNNKQFLRNVFNWLKTSAPSLQQVSTPQITPAAGTYTSAQSVTINCATAGVAIKYTTDGSTPSAANGTLYSSEISVSAATTIKAIAIKPGMADSAIAVATYNVAIQNYIESSQLPGRSLNASLNEVVNNKIYVIGGIWSDIEPKATTSVSIYDLTTQKWLTYLNVLPYGIYRGLAVMADNNKIYITPGNGPTINNGWGSRQRMLELDLASMTCIEKASFGMNIWSSAIAKAPNGKIYVFGGWTGSGVRTIWRYDPALDTLTNIGSLAGPGRSSIRTVTGVDGKIYLFGGNVSGGKQIEIFDPATETIKLSSVQLSDTYIYERIVFNGLNNKIYVSTSGTVFYEYDAVTDTIKTINYTLPSPQEYATATRNSTDSTVYIIGGSPYKSDVSIINLQNINQPAASPSFDPAAGTYTSTQSVILTTTTAGATIKYTLDGSTPSVANGAIYSSAISVSATTTIKAIAIKAGMADSELASANYTISVPAQWTQATAAAAFGARYSYPTLMFDNKMWIIGGFDGSNGKSDVWSSSDGISWTQVTANAAFGMRFNSVCLAYNNKMWVIGGRIANTAYNDAWYSTDGATWTQATTNGGFIARSSHTGVVFNNKMWVYGGISGPGTLLNDVWSSSDGATWTQATANAGFSPRYCHVGIVYDNKMWVNGGQINLTGTNTNDVWYSTDGTTWTQSTASAAFTARGSHSSVVYDNKMWVIGGHDGARKNDMWYSTDGVTWTQNNVNSYFSARYGQSALVYNNKIWVIAGKTTSVTNDVWYYGN